MNGLFQPKDDPRQRGLTLAEILISLTILLIASQTALLLYDAAWDSFKRAENAAEQQQGTRIAFDKLALDLQMAGFNYNPDGDDSRLDEQIEAAYDSAIVLRGDFDFTSEEALEGGAFEIVTTGNDEIVAYVLAKPDGSSSDTVTFHADVKDVPRDGVLEIVNIDNVALVLTDPPYTLYRITLNEDVATWSTLDFTESVIVAENIESLYFRYFDVAGNQLNIEFDPSTSGDDIGGGESELQKRASIHRIEMDLAGRARQTGPSTHEFKTFQLKSSITARNMGRFGIADPPS